jgi:hypothetical protein
MSPRPREHLEDGAREPDAEDLGVGVGRARREVLLVAEAEADAAARAARAALALLGAGAEIGSTCSVVTRMRGCSG